MTDFELSDEKNMDVLVEEFLYLAGFANADQLVIAYEGNCLRESTMFKICSYYDEQYGTTYVKDVERLLGRKMNPKGRKMNPKGRWVD